MISALLIFSSYLFLQSQQPKPEPHSWAIEALTDLVFAASDQQGLVRSRDGGRTWEAANRGLPPSIGAAPVTPVLAVAAAARDPRVLYCATEVAGIYRSLDFGENWETASSGLPVPLDHATRAPLLAVDPANPNWVYAMLTVPVHSHSEETLLFRSADAGLHWTLLKELPPGRTEFESMIVESSRRIRLVGKGDPVEVQDGLPAVPREQLGIAGVLGAERADRDVDGVAVVEDDGSLLIRQFALDQKGFEFRPASADGYTVVGVPANVLSETGSRVELGDDAFQSVSLPFIFRFYGRDHSTAFVNSNGNLSFNAGDADPSETSAEFFAGVPKIAPLWDDLDPRNGGVFVNASAERFVVTWSAVPEFGSSNSNTLQVTLLPSGVIQFQYGRVDAADGLMGVSNGGVTSGHFVAFADGMNLSGLSVAPIHELFGTVPLNGPAISRRFYQTHDDEFDALLVFGASELPANLAGGAATAFHSGVRNDVRGIGRSTLDATSSMGSGGRLQSYLNMNSLALYPADPNERIGTNNDSTVTLLGQEWGHRYLAYTRFRDGSSTSTALLGRDNSHWSYFFNSEASAVEGNEWRANRDGSFTVIADTERFGRLDQYLMGLREAGEVPPLMLITSPEPVVSGTIAAVFSTFSRTNNAIRDASRDFTGDRFTDFQIVFEGTSAALTTSNTARVLSSGRTENGTDPGVLSTAVDVVSAFTAAAGKPYSLTKVPASVPRSRYFQASTGRYTGDNIVFRGTQRDLSVADLVAQEGPRVPAAGRSPTAVRHAFILVVPRGKQATDADLAKLAGMRRAWEAFYSRATDGRGTVSTSLDRPASNDIHNALSANATWVYTAQSPRPDVAVGFGAISAGSDPVSGVAIFASRTGGQVVSEASVAASPAFLRARFFVERTATINTGFAAAAPTGASTLTLELRDTRGQLVVTTTEVIASGGHLARFVPELFPNFTFPAAFAGSLTVSATSPVAIVTLRAIVNQAGDFLITTLPVADLGAASSSDPVILPQIANAGGYVTELLLVNSGSTELRGTAEFFASNGAPLSLTVNGISGTSFPYTLTSNGASVLRTSGGSGTVQTGYVILRPGAGSGLPLAPIAGAVFTYTQNGLLVGATGVAATSPARRVRLYYDRTAGHDTGVAIVNPSTGTASLQLTIRNSSGTAGSPGTQTLPGGNHNARFISEISPSLAVGSRGVLDITSDVPVAVLALRSTVSGNRYLLSTLPIDNLDNLPGSRPLYFPQRAQGGGFTTEFILINHGSGVVPVKLSLVAGSTP